MQAGEQVRFVGGQPRVPDVDDQHDPFLFGVIPRLVLEVVVEYQAACPLPAASLRPDPDRTIPVGNLDPEVASQPQVGWPPVRGDVGVRAHPRDVDQPVRGEHRVAALDQPSGLRARGAHLIVAPTSLIQEDHVPVAGAGNRFTLTREPRNAERLDLGRHLGRMLLQRAGQRNRRRCKPWATGQIRVDDPARGRRRVGDRSHVTGKALAACGGGGAGPGSSPGSMLVADQLRVQVPRIGREGTGMIAAACRAERLGQLHPTREAQPLVPRDPELVKPIRGDVRPGSSRRGVSAHSRGIGQPDARLADRRTCGCGERQPARAPRGIGLRKPLAVGVAAVRLTILRHAPGRGEEIRKHDHVAVAHQTGD